MLDPIDAAPDIGHAADVPAFFNRDSNAGVPRNLLHVEQELLERYALGEVHDEDELGPMEEHLLICEECIDRLAELDGWPSVDAALTAAGLILSDTGRSAGNPPDEQDD